MRWKNGGCASAFAVRRSCASVSSWVRSVARCASVAVKKSVPKAVCARASTSASPARKLARSSSVAHSASSRSMNRSTCAARAPGVSVAGMISSAIVATVSLWCGSSTWRTRLRARRCAGRPAAARRQGGSPADGGGGARAGVAENAKRSGAADCVIEDLREEFVRDFVFPTLRAGAVYARTYLLGTSMARPAIAAHQVALAQRIGAQAVAHGCTGKGNDQVRFELTYTALAPELQVIAPWREWAFKGREDLIAYVRAKGIPVQATVEKPYSTDRNLWHCSHEGGILEDPSQEAPEHIFVMTKNPVDAPAEPVVVHVGFEEGTPVAVDHVPLGPVELLEALNDVAGEHGVGRADVVEDRLVGMKSRGVYETPGGTLLYAAHRELEPLVLDRRTLRLKDEVALRYADLVYDGRWWTPEREALDALVSSTQKRVTGSVRLKLYKGSITVAGRESPYALYLPSYATFGKDNVYNQKDAEGFIHLYGLAMKIEAGLEAVRREQGVGAAAD